MGEELEKAITAEGLGDGKKPPAKLKPEEKLPSVGLVLAPPVMAQSVIDGKKMLVVKSRSLELDNKDYVLLSQRKALGVVRLGAKKQIDDKEFTKLEPEHLITAKMRKDWCEAQPSWCKGPLYAWPVKVVEKFDEPRDTNVKAGVQVLVTDVEVKQKEKVEKVAESLKKIADPKTYDGSKVTDSVLRDDFRLTLAWYANWKKDPKNFKHDLETIETLLRGILKEAAKRGPKVMRFDPQGMKPGVRQFFLRVARDVKLPKEMLKAVDLAPGMEVEDMTDAELKAAHWQLHGLFDKEKRSQTGVKGWSTEDIVNLHARVVDKMFGRKAPHPPPPDNGLDELSSDFEKNAAKQPDWHTEPKVKIEKREYATINRSGVKQGKEIKIEEVLKHFKTFKMRMPYIYLVGGLANHGKTDGDIDILVNEDGGAAEWMKDIVEFRLGRCLPPELAKRLEIHYDRARGPFTNFVELFDLVSERTNTKNEVKQMRDSSGDVEEGVEKQAARAASAELKAQADKAKKDDKLTLGSFFHQPKPTRAAQPEQAQTIKNFVALYKEHAEDWLPTFTQKKFDGASHQGHVDGDKVTIFSEDGDDNTDRLPGIVAELKALKVKKLVLPMEIEMWDGQQHLPREAVAGYLNSKDDPDDSSLVANIYDVIYHGKEGDVHKSPTEDRLELLDDLGIKQSTMGAPNLKHRLNASPAERVDDLEELESSVRRIRKLPGSEGVVNKMVDAPYPLKETTGDMWVKFHSATNIGGIVIGREKTRAGAWVYQYGVLPGKEDAQETVKVGDKTVVPVGDTFATSRDFEAGDGILIEAETVDIERSPGGLKLTAWVPRVLGELSRDPDTVDQVRNRASRNLVLQQKDVDEKGAITYRPTRKRIRVQKQQDPYMEVPSEDKTHPFTAQFHWRGKGYHSDIRLGLRSNLLIGWTMNTQIAGVVKEPVTTVKEAKRWSSEQNMDKVSKVNFHTGEWAERPKTGATKLVRTEILSERKAPHPGAWLGIEGKTKDPEPGKAPPVGGTRQFPGVFDIVDEGTVEYLAQKPWFHEYAFHGGGLNYRMFFRLLKLAKRDERADCEACGSDAETDVGWADEPSTALCKGCTTEYLEKANVILPPSEEQPLKDEATWLAIYPDDQTPNVISVDAVKKGWMPPDGVSALPAAIRKQVPKEYQYWKAKGAKAKELRDGLVKAMKDGDVEIDVQAPYKNTQKATPLSADFVLQEQTWKGPTQIRIGPTRTRWWVRLDIGRKKLAVLDLQMNPLDNKKIAARVTEDGRKGSMKLSGEISPGHYLNPTKDTPSLINLLDSGKAEVTSMSKDLIEVRFGGKKLKGIFVIKRNNDEWLWSPGKEEPKTEDTEKRIQFELTLPIVETAVQKAKKGKKEKRLVTGIVLEPNVVDGQGDIVAADVIEKAAHQFVRDYNKATQMGLMHTIFGDNGIELVESWIVPVAFKLNGRSVKKGSWIMTVHITDDTVWKKIKRKEITGFSIGGVATVASS